MKTIHKLLLAVFIVTNLFLAKAAVLPNPTIAQISACQIGNGGTFNQGDPLNVSAQGSNFRAGDWTYIQGYTTDPSKSELELGYLINMPTPGYYILQTTVPSNAESGATYIVRVLHDTTVNDCGTIVIGGGIPSGGNPGANVDCSKADVNGDGKIDLDDAQAVAFHVAPAPYDAKYDLNSDAQVNKTDIDAVIYCFPPLPSTPPTNTSSGNNPCLDTNGDGKVDMCPTAIGNIPTNLGDFATAVLQIALGIAGGIVLILMVIGSIRVMTSSGDPQRVAAGRDMIVAALAGALFIAFSVMIMQFFGTAIVPIPGLTFGT